MTLLSIFLNNQLNFRMLDVFGFFAQHDEHTQLRSKAPNDHSFPLCAKIIEAFVRSTVKFHIHTLFVLRHNTKIGTVGNALPIFSGFLVSNES